MSDLTPDAEKSHQIKISLRTRLLTARRSLPVAVRSAADAQLQDQIIALVRRTGARSLAAYVPVGSEPGGPDLPDRLLAALPPDGRLLLPVLLPDNDLTWADAAPPPASSAAHPTPHLTSSPGNSKGPASPGNPPASANPGSPAVPANPGSPAAPANPGSPTVPADPGSPAAPADPGSPTAPVSPGGPVAPVVSADPPGPRTGRSLLVAGPRGLREPAGPRLGVEAVCSVDLLLVPALAVGGDGTRMGRGGGSYDRVLARLPEPGPLVVALLHDGEDVDFVPAEPHDRRVHAVITPTGGFARRPYSPSGS
jgi:5-formyltetrahydrofolate cyclo-ligase